MSVLGCGNYDVYFQARGGAYNVCRADGLTALSYNRTLNEASEATVSLALRGQDESCCACIGSLNPWEHEIVIYRDGEEVWVGPIVNIDIDLDALTANFQAKDLFAWTDKRWIELSNDDGYDVEEVELSTVFEWILFHGYSKDPWNMTWSIGSTGIPMDRFYPGFDGETERWGGSYMMCGEELRQLAESGCDFTVVRRTLVGGDLQVNPPSQIPLLIDRHWTKLPTIKVVGTGMAEEVAVAGGGGGYYGYYDEQIWIERPDDEFRERFGLLQYFKTDDSLDDENTTDLPNAITQQAYGLRELKKQPFTYVTGGQLSMEAPVTFDTLIPGAVVNLALSQTCRTVEDEYRLVSVSVAFDGEEHISIELTPKGVEALRT